MLGKEVSSSQSVGLPEFGEQNRGPREQSQRDKGHSELCGEIPAEVPEKTDQQVHVDTD